jgi:hypothetical protein
VKFLPPGVVGCYGQFLSGIRSPPCQAGLPSHSRGARRNAVRDLPPEGMSRRFLAPRFVPVNAKIWLTIRYSRDRLREQLDGQTRLLAPAELAG